MLRSWRRRRDCLDEWRRRYRIGCRRMYGKPSAISLIAAGGDGYAAAPSAVRRLAEYYRHGSAWRISGVTFCVHGWTTVLPLRSELARELMVRSPSATRTSEILRCASIPAGVSPKAASWQRENGGSGVVPRCGRWRGARNAKRPEAVGRRARVAHRGETYTRATPKPQVPTARITNNAMWQVDAANRQAVSLPISLRTAGG